MVLGMNKKIKEILEFKEDADYKRLSIEDILLLKEYITNLQEKLKSIKENYKIQLEYDKDLEKRFNSLLEAHKKCDELEQEKQERIDKAVELVKENFMGMGYMEVDKLFNILKGSDNSEKQ